MIETKILYIGNVGRRVGNFSYSAMLAALKLEMEFHIASSWTGYDNPKDKEADEEKYGIKIHQVDFIRQPLDPRNIKAFNQVCEIINRENIDGIHCNTPIGGVVGRLAGKKFGLKTVIYQAHGFHFYKGAPKKNWLFYYPIEKWLANFTDALITINTEDYEFAKKNIRLKDNGILFYIPGVGIDLQPIRNRVVDRNKVRIEIGVPTDCKLLISTGELNRNKNNKTIIKSLAHIKNNNIHYVLCGVGPEQKNLLGLAKTLNIANRIHFLGFQTDVIKLLKASDIFVMPSFREGLSRSIMEAMSCGLPCVISKIRGNVDLVKNGYNGYTCNPNDEISFAESINKILSDNSLYSSMQINNKYSIQELSLTSLCKEYMNCYKKILMNE